MTLGKQLKLVKYLPHKHENQVQIPSTHRTSSGAHVMYEDKNEAK